jgi:hypothetical protein
MGSQSRWVTAACLGILAGASGTLACNKGDAGSTAASPAPSANAPAAAGKHGCRGMNDCKGQGGCATDMHGCKGQNACKGQGGCKMS